MIIALEQGKYVPSIKLDFGLARASTSEKPLLGGTRLKGDTPL